MGTSNSMRNAKKRASVYTRFILLLGLLSVIVLFSFSEIPLGQSLSPQSSASVPNQDNFSEPIIPIPFTIIEQGQFSEITQKQYVVVDSQAEWQNLWRRHTGQKDRPFQGTMIDFTDTTVIGLFLGKRSTGGFSIAIQDLVATQDEIIVNLVETAPPPDAMVAQVLTAPFQIIQVPKISKPIQFHQIPSP